ncbi:MAG: transcriptional regulator [Spirochaetaceae bacterium]|nr:MAG: transcriptional regulator [Spirochaetaceae bacterium]
MMDERRKQQTLARLKRIEGQVRGIQKMVAEDRYCMDVIAQTRAVVAALRAAEDVVMETHMNTCVADAFRSHDPAQQREKIDEVMTVLAQFRKHG